MTSFRKMQVFALLLFVTSILVTTGCASVSSTGEVDSNGLLKLQVEGIERVAVHPGADLASFSKIYIEPVEVSFRRGWRPMRTGSHMTVSSRQLDDMKVELRNMFTAAFIEGLQSNTRLEIVDTPAPEVLRITPRVIDVSAVNILGDAPAGEARAMQTLGSASLELSINDVRTGIVVVEIESTRHIVNNSRMSLDSMRTREGFNDIFSAWGRFTGQGILNISPAGNAAP